MRFAVVVAIACLQAASVRAQGNEQRYPWDERPKKCFMPGAEPFGQCLPGDNYPSPERTMHYVSNLYYNDTFGLLERYLSELVASNKRFQDGQYAEEVIWRAFTRIMPMAVDNGSAKERNAQWRKAVPESKFVVLAEAALLRAAAWNVRGTGLANTVSKQSWELFAIRSQEAEEVLLQAPAAARDSPAWHIALLATALDSDRVGSKPNEVFDRAVKRWPTYAVFYQLTVERMIPKWGGSWEEVESFIVKANKMQPASEGNSLYARLYIYLIPQRSARESNFDRRTMNAGFEDAIARFSDPKYKNLYASYACLAKDRELFSRAMSKIPREELIPAWWLDGNSYDSCVRWAGV